MLSECLDCADLIVILPDCEGYAAVGKADCRLIDEMNIAIRRGVGKTPSKISLGKNFYASISKSVCSL